MPPSPEFLVIYAPITKLHLKAIERQHHSFIRATIEAELQFEPDVETINRKPLTRPVAFEADWELRFGAGNRFRVFYHIDAGSRSVYILAIGVKDRNRLLIGGEGVKL